jgi:hypothetical protein
MRIVGKDAVHTLALWTSSNATVLTKKGNLPGHESHHQYTDRNLVPVEDDVVKLNVNAAPRMEQSGDGV